MRFSVNWHRYQHWRFWISNPGYVWLWDVWQDTKYTMELLIFICFFLINNMAEYIFYVYVAFVFPFVYNTSCSPLTIFLLVSFILLFFKKHFKYNIHTEKSRNRKCMDQWVFISPPISENRILPVQDTSLTRPLPLYAIPILTSITVDEFSMFLNVMYM